MERARLFCILFIAPFVLSTLSVKLEGQTAQVTGLVTDTSGSVVPGAAITVTNEATGVSRKTESDAAGIYNVPALASGAYTIRAQKAGFDIVERTGITLTVAASTTVNVQLSVQHVSQVVEVHGNATVLQTSSPELSTVVTQEEYNDLPLIQVDRYRTPSTFMFLAPGVQGSYAANGQPASSSIVPAFYVHGSGFQEIELNVDGLNAGQSRELGDLNESSPPVDAFQEFNFTTVFLGAQYGHSGTATANYTLKSGTNDFHGEAYDYFETRDMNAAPWGSGGAPNTHEDEFGAAIGGPVIIPHIYNGRNRTFLFFLYGGSRKTGLDTLQSLTIGTPAEIGGNFSALTRPIYDPATTTLQSNGTYTRTAFPGNIIPPSRLDPVAKAIASYLPAPNQAGAVGAANYKTFAGEQLLNPSVWIWKIDHEIAASHHLSVSFIHTDIPRFAVVMALPAPLLTVGNQTTRSTTVRINYDWTIGPNKLNNLAMGLNRFDNLEPPPEPNTNWPQVIGLSGVNGGTFPYIDFLTNGYTYLASYRNIADFENTYLTKDTFMWTINKHLLSIGAEFRRPNYNDTTATPAHSQFNFSALESGSPTATGTTGDSFASFMLGASDGATLTEPYSFFTRFEYYGVFLQDDYKVTPRLTLNGGFRWEFETPPIEKENHSSNISLTTPNPGAGNLPGALVFAGPPPVGTGARAFIKADHSGVSGRFGASFLANPRTVLRAGYGIYYADVALSLLTNGFQAQAQVSSPNNGTTPALYLANGFPGGGSLEPTLTPTLLNGQSATYVAPNADAMPRIQQWTAGIEQSLGKDWRLSISYVGNHGTRLVNQQMANINQVNSQYLSFGSLLTAPVTSAAAQAAGFKPPYPGFSGTVAQSLRAYPQYLTLTSLAAKEGVSVYNDLEVDLTRRFSNGFTFEGNYTYAKALGYGSATEYANTAGGVTNGVQDIGNPHADWSLLPNDVRNTFIFYYVYDLPFGTGRPWLNQGGLMNQLIGGWRLSAIQRYQSGFPLELLTANSLPIFNYALRPNRVPGVPMNNHIPVGKYNPVTSRMINSAAFSQPAPYTFGNASPAYDGLTQYSILNEDVTLMKAFHIKEHVTWTWYGQFFNVFNRHTFTGPDTNFNDAGFGETTGVSTPRKLQIATRISF